MKVAKWWDLAFGGGLLLLAVINAIVVGPNELDRWLAWATLAALGGCYLAFGRRALRQQSFAIAFVIVLILACGAATAFSPPLATLQALAIPYLWCLVPRVRNAIALNARSGGGGRLYLQPWPQPRLDRAGSCY